MLQAQRQVLLISDSAGMGKTIILTHLAKQIKQNCPCQWVVRIDLNDHTDALKAQHKKKHRSSGIFVKKIIKIGLSFRKGTV